jgi:hypothetical protein
MICYSYGTPVPAEASVEASLQYWISLWGDQESAYTQNIFNGSATSNSLLGGLIKNGTMLNMPSNVTLETAISQIQTVAHGQLIQFAWQNGPGNFVPFVLYVIPQNSLYIKSRLVYNSYIENLASHVKLLVSL